MGYGHNPSSLGDHLSYVHLLFFKFEKLKEFLWVQNINSKV